MIAHSDDEDADQGGEIGENLFVECCNYVAGDEDEDEMEEECSTTSGKYLQFPTTTCDFLGIGFGACQQAFCMLSS